MKNDYSPIHQVKQPFKPPNQVQLKQYLDSTFDHIKNYTKSKKEIAKPISNKNETKNKESINITGDKRIPMKDSHMNEEFRQKQKSQRMVVTGGKSFLIRAATSHRRTYINALAMPFSKSLKMAGSMNEQSDKDAKLREHTIFAFNCGSKRHNSSHITT